MKRILLLDDNIAPCQLAIQSLEKQYDVVKCRDILTAKRRIALGQFSLFIIDLMMPTRGLNNGDEFTAGISFFDENVKGKYNCPVLFWTNLSDTSISEYLKTHPDVSVEYLQKNDNIQSLIDKVNQILK